MTSTGATAGNRAAEAFGTARRAADSRPVGWAARAGLTARGLVYVLIGLLALLVARGDKAEVDQKGALAQVLAHPYGGWLVGAMGVGFAAYALWRLSEAAFGVTGEPGAGPRLRSLVRALVYLALAYSAFSLVTGSRTSQSGQQSALTAQTMAHPGGRYLVAVVGAAVAVAGFALAWEGLQLKFMKYFPDGELNGRTRTFVRRLGRIGTVARGLVFALAGCLVVGAAWAYDPSKAAGLDGALKTLRAQPFGPLLLAAVAIGLVAFGVYGLAEARYRRV